MALFSQPRLRNFSSFSAKPNYPLRPRLHFILPRVTDNSSGIVISASLQEKLDAEETGASPPDLGKKDERLGLNSAGTSTVLKFRDPRWVSGTWDLKQFSEDGKKTNWDAVIDAEARRRKWLEDDPESSSNDDPVLFDTSIVPWWVWMKRFHLPEAELLNGRVAMIGFFMAYLVDGLTGVGPVDQTGNFFCKTLLFVAVVGVLLIRKNDDIETLKRLLDETTLYDKQWQATWKDDTPATSK